MKKSLVTFCLITTLNLNAVENECYSLSKKAQKIMDSPTAKNCFEKTEHRRLFGSFLSNYRHHPETFSRIEDVAVVPVAKQLTKEIIELVKENLEWSVIRAFGLEFLKLKIAKVKESEDFDALELRELNNLFDTKYKQKMESTIPAELIKVQNESIIQAITTIQNLLEYNYFFEGEL